MDKMRQRLLHFIELDAYLDDQAISAPREERAVQHDTGTAGRSGGSSVPPRASPGSPTPWTAWHVGKDLTIAPEDVDKFADPLHKALMRLLD